MLSTTCRQPGPLRRNHFVWLLYWCAYRLLWNSLKKYPAGSMFQGHITFSDGLSAHETLNLPPGGHHLEASRWWAFDNSRFGLKVPGPLAFVLPAIHHRSRGYFLSITLTNINMTSPSWALTSTPPSNRQRVGELTEAEEAGAALPPQNQVRDGLLAAADETNNGWMEEERQTCESLYLGNGNCKKRLLSMCYGLKDGDRVLGVVTDDPYKSTKRKVQFIPNRDYLLDEIKRRADDINVLPRPRMVSKSVEQGRTWVLANPITDPVDVAFFKREEGYFRLSLQAALEEEQNVTQQTRTSNSASWTTCDPFLRLYHSLIDDEVINAFISRHAVMDRPK